MAFVGRPDVEEEEDVSNLTFPSDFEDAVFLTNAEAGVLLERQVKADATLLTAGVGSVFQRSYEYVNQFPGATTADAARCSELRRALEALRLVKAPTVDIVDEVEEEEDEDYVDPTAAAAEAAAGGAGGGAGAGAGGDGAGAGATAKAGAPSVPLDPFEVVALINLAPRDVAEALALVPSLARFEKDSLEECIDVLRRSSVRMKMTA